MTSCRHQPDQTQTVSSHCLTVMRDIRGYSLIEVMIALVVISFGLLAFAVLQMDGLKQSQAALYRSQAAILSNDLADRIRANRPGALDGGYRTQNIDQLDTPDCSLGCSPKNLAILDLKEWRQLLAQHLPRAISTVSCTDSDVSDALPCSDNSVHLINLAWDDNKDGQSSATIQITLMP